MSEQLRLRGDTAANVAAYTGPSRETVVDTTNNRLVVQDGVTPGGWPAAKLAEVPRIARTAITASYSATPTDRLIAVTALAIANGSISRFSLLEDSFAVSQRRKRLAPRILGIRAT